jgi:hypothetical protein
MIWTKIVPTEPGHYWFKGRKKNRENIEFSCPLRIVGRAGSLHYILDGAEWVNPNNLIGWFYPIILPPVPEE